MIDSSIEETWAQLREEIDEKNRIIQETNRMLEHTLGELSLLLDLTQTFVSTLDLPELLQTICEKVSTSLAIPEFAILLTDEQRRYLEVAATVGFPKGTNVVGTRFAEGEGVSGQVLHSRQLIHIEDISKDPRYLHYKGKRHTQGSFLSIPLKMMGTLLGVFNFHRHQVRAFAKEEIRLLQAVANQAVIAIHNAQLYKRTMALAIIDDLTKLYNRRFFEGQLEKETVRSGRSKKPLSLLMMDIDHFKDYNDVYGHAFGDEVLKKVSRVMLSSVRRTDTLARYGGEEFVLVLPGTSKQQAAEVAEKLRAKVQGSQFRFGEARIYKGRITISVGVAEMPGDTSDKDELVGFADAALYAAKNGGRNRVALYERDTSGGQQGA